MKLNILFHKEKPLRIGFCLLLVVLALAEAGCRKGKVVNPIANVDSKQPDKVLFDRALEAQNHGKFDVARITLQTLINTYPDSEYIARAKLGIADSWYAEGGSAGFAQAEMEYKDFKTFFPNLPEAAEAQYKVAGIHYKQIEKPDRDFTHAKRAEDEYRDMIQEFPDSKLIPEAKQRLREVQEVLAEREYRIGHFYYLHESYPAAIARLKSVTDAYPLYSGDDDALFLLGQSFEREMEMVRAGQAGESIKAKLLEEFTTKAAEAYGKILTRYPAMARADDARERLKALHRPVPTATPEMLSQNKAEEASRQQSSKVHKVMLNFEHGPDLAPAVHGVGEPSMTDPKQTSATDVLKDVSRMVEASSAKTSVETIHNVKPGESQPIPHSAGAITSGSASSKAVDPASTGSSSKNDAPTPAPIQVNDAPGTEGPADANANSSSANPKDDKKKESTSKKKKKHGLAKLNPF